MHSVYLATKNCQSEIATSDYENFYQIKCGNTNGNELNVNVYVDDPSEVNILLASNNRYENEDKDNYEFGLIISFARIFFKFNF